MRVTETQLHRLAITSLGSSRERLMDAQKIAMTGTKVSKPSDDPTVAARARVIRSLLEESKAYQGNIDQGFLRLQRAEQSLADSASIFVRAKELSLAMANATMDSEQRESAAEEIAQLRNSLRDMINTKSGNEFVFANTNSTTPPVDNAGVWNYDPNTFDSVRAVEIGPSSMGEIGASASHAFGQRAADPGSLDALAVLETLEANLRSNDPDAIRSSIDELDQVHGQVIAERARVGMRMNRIETSMETAKQAEQLYIGLESSLVDADAAEAFSDLSLAQTTLQTAVSVSSRILGPSMLDVL